MNGSDCPFDSHISLPSGEWAVWKPFALRAPGFPASGVSRLAAPDLARAADLVIGADATKRDWESYRSAFDAGMLKLSTELQSIARAPDFQLALTWQNHHAAKSGLGSFLRRRITVDGRNHRHRQKEDMLANYWQRYCVKNDTIGFFGPVGWGRLDERKLFSDVTVGSKLTSNSEVFFETWAIDSIAAKISMEDGMKKWLAPKIIPFVKIDERSAHLPGMRAVPLSPEESAVIRRCDGVTSAYQIAKDVDPDSVDNVYEILERLAGQRVLTWRLDLPISLHPETALREILSAVGEPTLAAEGLAKLDRLEAARDDVRLAGDDPVKLSHSLDALDEIFRQITCAEPSRNHGKMYAGRTLVFLDALRNVTPIMGCDFLTALRPLELVLRSVRWFTYEIGKELITKLLELMKSECQVSLAWLWMNSMPIILGQGSSIIDPVITELQRRWRLVLDCADNVRSLEYGARDLEARVAQAFPAPRAGWNAARYCSPDFMISAADPSAFRRGDFRLVLGELHIAINTLRSGILVALHPCPDELFKCVDAEGKEPRLHPVLPKQSGRLSARTRPALIRETDFMVSLFDQTTDPARPRVLRAADLSVERAGGRLWVTAPGGHRFDVLDVFSEMLMNLVGDKFDIFGDRSHTPRLTVDRLVVARESWVFSTEQLPFTLETDEAVRFARAREWVHDISLPHRVFVKVPGQQKPFYVDFDSPIYVNLLSKTVRAAVSAHDAAEPACLKFTEMMPSMENLWLRDSGDNYYTAELRLAVFDLMERS
ncbi:lantibiotic dehydratase family protein [Saccharomonospora marina XMU15]|uniref:Lantibiotic dehydratase family protein n=1 Tax=Saccharomonospora marina XMU15 TaxID=882083 RepID=H5X6Y2_9PSEU|nr:lantibiotic dehydratase [Saccharomonospora marina]EHR52412.1 lantibiotic dehydratase family protein [Saccharomonospora marina XMU15]